MNELVGNLFKVKKSFYNLMDFSPIEKGSILLLISIKNNIIFLYNDELVDLGTGTLPEFYRFVEKIK